MLVNGFAVVTVDSFHKRHVTYFLTENAGVECYANEKNDRNNLSVEFHKNTKVTPQSCKDYAK